ncbi:MAG: hypothetical protein PHW82_08770 [Bacteroidales bacterium]|nr:hypothetical protein [Bacteroidales bacterium]
MKSILSKVGISFLAVILLGSSGFAQLNLKPRVTNIAGNHEFVFVTKANPKFEKPERAVMSDFKVNDEAFNPYKLDTYTTWRFDNLTVRNHDGSSTRYVAIINNETGFYYSRKSEMKTSEEFEKATKRDETGSFKDFWGAMEFYFEIEVKEWPYIWLRIPNKENKNLVVTQMTWNTRDFKLVLVK